MGAPQGGPGPGDPEGPRATAMAPRGAPRGAMPARCGARRHMVPQDAPVSAAARHPPLQQGSGVATRQQKYNIRQRRHVQLHPEKCFVA